MIPGIVFAIHWLYRRESTLPRRQRHVLSVLRILAVIVVLIASFRPALETTRNLRIRSEVHFLIDDSASMGRHETYGTELSEELRSALGEKAPESLAEWSRSELVSKFFGGGGKDTSSRAAKPAKRLLEGLEKDFDLKWYRFSDRSYPISKLSELRSDAPYTRIGDALDLHQGQFADREGKLEAVILVTDGRNNEGVAPTDSARHYRAAEVPVHVLGVGDPSAEHNLVLRGPDGPQQVLQNEEAVFTLDIRATGLDARQGELVLKAFKHEDRKGAVNGDPATLENVSFPLPKDGELRQIKIRHRFEEPGDYILIFEVPPLPGETNPKDNVTRRYLRVDSDKVRVLYLEEQPRWEYRYLQQALKRVDKSIQLQCFLFDASRNFEQEHSKDAAPLLRLPATRQELFRYHVILIGDVPPQRFGATEEERAQWFELLKEFVEHGGGLGVIAGEGHMPENYRETAIEDLLPVVLGNPSDEDLPGLSEQAFLPVPENPHEPHPILRLSDNDETNRFLWKRGLHGMWWYYPVLRAKAGATVLLRHPSDQNKYGRRVLAAVAPYPKGRTFFVGFDEVWRWRKPYGERYMDPYWRRVVRYLAESKLRRMDDRVLLTVDKNQVELGGKIAVEVQILDEDFNPVRDERTKIHLRLPSGELLEIEVPRLQGRPGEFESTIPLEEPGVYSVLVYPSAQPGDRPLAREDVIVSIPDKELDKTSLNESLLKETAEKGGGVYARLHHMDALLDGFRDRAAGLKVVDRKTREIWDGVWTLLLVLFLLSLEWILRKRWKLV